MESARQKVVLLKSKDVRRDIHCDRALPQPVQEAFLLTDGADEHCDERHDEADDDDLLQGEGTDGREQGEPGGDEGIAPLRVEVCDGR